MKKTFREWIHESEKQKKERSYRNIIAKAGLRSPFNHNQYVRPDGKRWDNVWGEYR